MKTNFTPAPWVVTEVEPCVCSWTFDFEKMNIGSCIHNSEMKANINLIAAAPEMYEMLREFINLVENDSSEDFLYKFNEINELLAKARGE